MHIKPRLFLGRVGSLSKKGAALMPVLIIGTGLLTVLTSSLQRGVTEKNINHRHHLRHEAKNAAESVCEYGFAELVRRFEVQTSFPIDELNEANNPLSIPQTFDNFFDATLVDTEASELQGGQVPPGHWEYIDPNDPANEFDPLKGRRVFVREVEVFAEAKAKSDKQQAHATAYTMQKLQVRDAPLFGHAIFYNMDLELHPGPIMNVYGPVHANHDAYLQAANEITFHEGVASSSEVVHGSKKTGSHTQQGEVYIKDGGGVSQDMYNGTGDKNVDSSWLDHRDADWRSKASQRWDGNLQDVDHGVPYLNPLGIEEYVPDDPFTPENELRNYAYAVIEPLLPTGHPDRKDDAYRDEKYAFKAGLLLRVSENAGAPTGFEIKAYKYQRENASDPNSLPVIDVMTGNPVEIEVVLPPGLIGDSDAVFTNIETSGQPEVYSEDGAAQVDGGMFDHREDVRHHMVSIDVGMLRKYVDDTHPDNIGNPAAQLKSDYWSNDYDPTKNWNGVVYIEFPPETNSGGRADKIVRAKSYVDSGDGLKRVLALQTIDAEELPSPTYLAEKGLSIATNAPLYMVGNFNADGVAHTNDATAPEAGEPPASVAADSVTILSNNWDNNRKYSNQNSKNNRVANYTEVSAAILTGLKPTIPDDPGTGTPSSWISGGAHNFPRFLEKWSNKELTIRGSLVALFESEVHELAMPTNFSHYYSPPKRDWGFHDDFKAGNYPPGSPNARTFRRVQFRDLTAEEYDYEIENIWTGS